MPEVTVSTVTQPYGTTALKYQERGWLAPLPLQPKTKYPPPTGTIGAEGKDPTREEIRTWTAENPRGNICLRLPDTIIGIDVDAHSGKKGGETLRTLEETYGELPATWTSTSREDGVSGIRLFRIPPGLTWKEKNAGQHIDLITRTHRYVVCWPSLHPEGNQYKWITPGGEYTEEIPSPDDLPPLPDRWVDLLTHTQNTTTHTTTPFGQAKIVTQKDADRELVSRTLSLKKETGERNNVLNRHAFSLAGYVGPGFLSREQILASMTEACSTSGNGYIDSDGYNAFLSSFNSGFNDGLAKPYVSDTTFWSRRTELWRIHQVALARRANPWGTLGAVLARIAALTPPSVCLPGLFGGDFASLNPFIALVAHAGGGKGTSYAASEHCLHYPPPAIDLHTSTVSLTFNSAVLGTAEGMVDMYRRRYHAPHGNNNNGKASNSTNGHAPNLDPDDSTQLIVGHSTFFYNPEIARVNNEVARAGSKLVPELCQAFFGEILGHSTRDRERSVTVRAHRYRMVWLVGIQPLNADVLLREAKGGLPQRILFLPALRKSRKNSAVVTDPGPFRWTPHPDICKRPAGGPLWAMPVSERVIEEIYAEDDARLEKLEREEHVDEEDLDVHSLFIRLKVAALLAILAGRADVNDEDWELAGTVMQISRSVRDGILGSLRTKGMQVNRAVGERMGHRRVAEADVVDKVAQGVMEDARKRIVSLITQKGKELVGTDKVSTQAHAHKCPDHIAEGGWVPRREVVNYLSDRQKAVFDRAVDELVSEGVLTVCDKNRGRFYRCSAS